ncbi:bactofilin family protein [Desulfofalx alkaliphila]|uniref:bactofilin family protein n=1 Tax=Desulfofalx alkaliphila TaxID=105483 RepID=UPI0004E0C41C|nr:polymer-forming cytoskeletal protein [Desulfofalx alkaliphila]
MFGKKQQPMGEKVDTIIGKGTHFIGSLNVKGSVRIDGKVEGEMVISGDTVIGKDGSLHGNIKGANATIAGELHGNITLEGKLEISNTGKVYGDIEVSSLVVNEGAVFKGNSIMHSGTDNSNNIEHSKTRERKRKELKASQAS